MPGYQPLTHRNIAEAEAFVREAMDEDGEVIAVDHPEFYCTKVHGVHRAALPRLSDRDFTSFRDAEDALIARIDGETEDESDELEFDGIDEYESDELEFDGIDDAPAVCLPAASEAPTPAVTVDTVSKEVYVTIRRAAKAPAIIVEDSIPPAVISCRRDVIIAAENTDEAGRLRAPKSWKDTTSSPAQFLRHAHNKPPVRPKKRSALL